MRPTTKRWLKRGVIGGVVAFVLLAGLTVYLLQRPPMAWRVAQEVLDQSTPQMREQITASVKERLANLVQTKTDDKQKVDPYQSAAVTTNRKRLGNTGDAVDHDQIADTPLDQFAELTLTNAELVAMVNEFYVDWTNQRGYVIPGGVNDPVVIARDGSLYITFMIQTPAWQQVFSGEVDLEFKSDGMAVGRVENLYAGSLPVSLLSIGETLRLQMPANEHETADRLGEWLSKLEHFEFRPVLELEHRRRARVLAMDVGMDLVTLKMRVQDHITYRGHNDLLRHDKIAVTDILNEPIHPLLRFEESGLVDVPTTTD